MTLQRMCNKKYVIKPLFNGRIAEISACCRKSGLRNTIVTSYFRPEMEIWPFRACAMKNMQCNPYLWPNCRNFRVLQEIGLRNTMMTSDLRPEVEIWPFRACTVKNMQYNRYYRNTSVIVDLDTGQIPRSAERISSYLLNLSATCKKI